MDEEIPLQAPEEIQEDISDSATDTGESLEETNEVEGEETSEDIAPAEGPESEPEPAGFTKRIHQKHHDMMEERRKREAAEQELIQLKSTMAAEQKPTIPATPDPYDENFDTLLAQREKAIIAAAKYDMQQERVLQEQEAVAQRQVADQNKGLRDSIQLYSERSTELGISPNVLSVAGKTVSSYGVSEDIVKHILDDESGPLMTVFFAQNPTYLDKLATLTPMRAAVYLETVVKPKVGKTKSTKTVPNPADTLSGGGAPPAGKGPKGATYT